MFSPWFCSRFGAGLGRSCEIGPSILCESEDGGSPGSARLPWDGLGDVGGKNTIVQSGA